MILNQQRHNCQRTHPYQDEVYNGGRVANYAVKESDKGAPRFRCTVCGVVTA